MVELHFRDDRGRTGQITETLEVEYAGEWEEEVAEGLQRIADEEMADERPEDDGVYTQIVLELPEEAPVVEVERTDDPVEPDPIER